MLATVVSLVNHCTYFLRVLAKTLRADDAEEKEYPSVTDTFVTKVAKDWKTAGLSSADPAL